MLKFRVILPMVFALVGGLASCGAPTSPEEIAQQEGIHAQFTVRRGYGEVRQGFEAFIRSCIANRSANYQPTPIKFLNVNGEKTTKIWIVNDALFHNPVQLIIIRQIEENLTEIISRTEYPPSIIERDLRDVSNSPTMRRC